MKTAQGGNEGNERKLEGYLHVLFRYLIEIFIVTTLHNSFLKEEAYELSHRWRRDFNLRCCFILVIFL